VLRERFARPLDRTALALSESTREDAELVAADVWGSRVHARMLSEVGLLDRSAARRIDRGLRAIAARAARGRFPLDPALEDVHLNVEAALTRAVGPDGERLHTGRSRNDQVATDLRLYLREALLALEAGLAEVVGALARAARGPAGHRVTVGRTHLQPAQTVYVAQLLGTHAVRLLRDAGRLRSIRERLTDCPLGSGALAGSSLPLDRTGTARRLGFRRPTLSSLDAVSDRDPEVETLGALALFAVHASGLAEELVIGSMPELGAVRLADPFVTTSSLLPHKRNPDLAELVRAESAPAIGRLTAHLALLKGLPLAYNRDLQLGKPLLFEGVRRARLVLDVLAPMVATADLAAGRDPEGALPDATGSVELVDALVRAGATFRSAHRRVARFLRAIEAEGGTLRTIPAARRRAAFPELADGGSGGDLPARGPEARTTEGGSSWASVVRLLAEIDRRRSAHAAALRREHARLDRLRAALDAPARRARS
jgi:argininosuccinate lyase